MKRTSRRKAILKPATASLRSPLKSSKAAVRKVYIRSVSGIKHHPYKYLTILSVGVGLLSSAFLLLNNRR